jgi:hypothetical protein
MKTEGKRNMGKIPILAKDGGKSAEDPGQPRGCYPLARPLPNFYMADYSVMGLLVDKLEEALRVLGENGFSVLAETGDLEVAIDHPGELQDLVRLLKENGIGCEINDVVSGIYQG